VFAVVFAAYSHSKHQHFEEVHLVVELLVAVAAVVVVAVAGIDKDKGLQL